MQPLVTLYEREPVSSETLPLQLASAYAGGLVIPEGTAERPYVFANFVETIDGIVSFNTPGQTGGGVISGDKEQDKIVMGILRAQADAILFGTSSLVADANHPRTPGFIYPPFTQVYADYRTQLGKQERYPLSVIVTASGKVDLNDRMFRTPDLHALIFTTPQGYKKLQTEKIPEGVGVHVFEGAGQTGKEEVAPKWVLQVLAQEHGVRSVLYEGGPTLLSSFLKERLIDELFLTFAPQLAGRAPDLQRLALVEGHAFAPKNAPWATLLSVKLADDHLLFRYRFS